MLVLIYNYTIFLSRNRIKRNTIYQVRQPLDITICELGSTTTKKIEIPVKNHYIQVLPPDLVFVVETE